MTKSYRRRRQIDGQFAWRLIEMLESPAYRVLSLSAHRVLARIEIELAHHGGMENGNLPVTYEQFEEFGMDRHAVAPAIRELVALGFIEITEEGVGGNAEFRRPSKYRLTYRHVGRANSTDEWRKITEDDAAMVAKGARRAGSNYTRHKKQKTSGGKRHVSVGKTHTENPISPVGETPTNAQWGKPSLLSISRGGGGGCGGPLERQAPPSQASRGNGHDAASETMPVNVTAPKPCGRPPLGLKAMTLAEQERHERAKRKANPSQDAPPNLPPSVQPSLAPERAPDDDDIPASLRRCVRCNQPADDDRGDVTVGRDGRWRHAVCHLLEGTNTAT